jgi:hypothetical protein
MQWPGMVSVYAVLASHPGITSTGANQALTDIEANTLAHLLVRHLLRRYGTGSPPRRGPARGTRRVVPDEIRVSGGSVR